jgi:rsbT co-antagonist protein RsbR
MPDTVADAAGQESFYRLMVETIAEYEVIRLDEKGIVCSWNTGAERMTRYTADEILGRSFSVFFPEEDLATCEQLLDEAARTGRLETEGLRVRKDGTRFWASVSLTPIRGDDGEVTGYVKVSRDMTEARRQSIALASIEGMVDSITDYEVIRLDHNGLVESWNPGAKRLKQYTAEEAVGHPASMFYTAEDIRAGVPDRDLATTARTGRLETDGWRVRKDGSRFWASVAINTIRDDTGALLGFVQISRDLTEKRDQEKLVQRQRDEILELSTPVIQVWDNVLVLPIIGTLDSLRASRLTESLLDGIAREQAEVVILDISGVPAIDTDVAQHLLKTVEAARLMGSTSILSGVRPETAQAIVHLGIELGKLRSRNNLKDALQLAITLVGAAGLTERSRVDA